jgi:ankyrin repeat protein
MAISYRAAQTLIKRGDEAGLRAALDAGLEANLTNQNGWTLLMLAAVEGDIPLGRLLVEKGADLAAHNLKGETPESIASHRGYSAFVQMLHEHDAPAG